jgi:hypothetical protein
MSETRDSAEAGASWQRRFEILERTGKGESLKAYLGNTRSLTFGERFTVGFNVWSLLIGPIYYFCKKMWLKGAFLLGVMWTWSAALSLVELAMGRALPSVAYYLLMPVCASLANYDYYRFRVKGERLWGGLPKFFSGKPGAIGFPCLALLVLVVAVALGLKDDPRYDAPETVPLDMPRQPPMPQYQPQPMPSASLEGMWMLNNGAAATFQGNFYVIAFNGQAVEGGAYAVTGGEMLMQVMQGQNAGQQKRYNYQPGPDGRSFTLSMQNGSGSITYQKTGELPPMPPQAMPQPGEYPQQMPQQGWPQQMPQQVYPQPMPQPYPQVPQR